VSFGAKRNLKLFERHNEDYVVIDQKQQEEISFSDKMDIVSNITMFKGMLSLEEISDIVSEAESQTFKADQLIVKKGMKTEKVYIICSGTVAIDHEGGEQTLGIMRRSDIVCWNILFSDTKVNAYSAICLTDTSVLAMRRDLCLFTIKHQILQRAKQIMEQKLLL
jgi:CRP-like cAMP-binding protein